MKSYIAVCAIGSDRIGFVEDISEYLAERDLNIEESRASVIGKEFGILMLISGESDVIESLVAGKEQFARDTGIGELIIRKTEEPRSRQLPDAMPYELEATSLDHPGIVHQITAVLHGFKVNIENMKTRVAQAPITGTPIFSLTASVYVPTSIKISDLRDELHSISDRFNIDISFLPEGG